MPPTVLPARAEILLLCDSAKVGRSIEMILHTNRHCQIQLIDEPLPWPIRPDSWDLILIAFSAASHEPLSVLSRAGLIQWVGRRPILIIMPSSFTSQPHELIWYLEFPFEAQTLGNCVAEILSATQALRPTAATASPPSPASPEPKEDKKGA